MASERKLDRDSDEVTPAADVDRSHVAGHAPSRVVWTADADPRSGAAARRQNRSLAPDSSATPSLMDTFAIAEQRIAQQLGDTAASIETDDAKRRLEILFWAQRQTDEIEDRRIRNQLDRGRLRGEVRRGSATGWLRVGNRASRFVLGVVAVMLLIGPLVELRVTGHLDPSDLVRVLPW